MLFDLRTGRVVEPWQLERLAGVRERLPEGLEPELGPVGKLGALLLFNLAHIRPRLRRFFRGRYRSSESANCRAMLLQSLLRLSQE